MTINEEGGRLFIQNLEGQIKPSTRKKKFSLGEISDILNEFAEATGVDSVDRIQRDAEIFLLSTNFDVPKAVKKREEYLGILFGSGNDVG